MHSRSFFRNPSPILVGPCGLFLAQCLHLTGMPSPDNQTHLRCSSRNNQKVVLTGIQYY